METGKQKILIVDDEAVNRTLIAAILTHAGYPFEMAENGREALAKMACEDFALVLLDIIMPVMDGYETLKTIREDPRLSHILVALVTALPDRDARLKGLALGANDFLTKPIDNAELEIRVRNLLKIQEFQAFLKGHNEILTEQLKEIGRLNEELTARARELKNLNATLEQRVEERTEDLRKSYEKQQQSLQGLIQVVSATVEIRDPYTAGHQSRVARLSRDIARELGYDEERAEGIRLAGTIHDLGKIGIPVEILSKPGKITDIELSLIQAHPQIGYDILKDVEFPWPIAQMVYQHHERLNGSGYPQGFRGEEIMPEARLLAVADVVEAMASHRPYRPALGVESALAEIEVGGGIRYDPQVVGACLCLFREKGYQLD